MELRKEAVEWVSKNFRSFFLVLLVGANIVQYKAAENEREEYRKFYEAAYRNELERSKKWEDIFITLRASSR